MIGMAVGEVVQTAPPRSLTTITQLGPTTKAFTSHSGQSLPFQAPTTLKKLMSTTTKTTSVLTKCNMIRELTLGQQHAT